LCDQWRWNKINIAGARRGQKSGSSKSEGLRWDPQVLGEGLTTLPTCYGVCGSTVRFPSVGYAKLCVYIGVRFNAFTYVIRLRECTQLKIHNQIEIKDFK